MRLDEKIKSKQISIRATLGLTPSDITHFLFQKDGDLAEQKNKFLKMDCYARHMSHGNKHLH